MMIKIKKIKIKKFYESFFVCDDCGCHSKEQTCSQCGSSYTTLIEQPSIKMLKKEKLVDFVEEQDYHSTVYTLIDGTTVIHEDEYGFTKEVV